MQYTVSSGDRYIATNKTNLAKTIQTLIDEGFNEVTVKVKIDRSLKHEVGDKVRVTACRHGHNFNIGEVVSIDELCYPHGHLPHYRAVNNGNNSWWIGDDECESI